jgi:tetratricopeptide (TPR) repeat protein
LEHYKKAAELDSTELHRYKAAYAATQCKPPRWNVAERLLSRNREVDSLLLLAQISQQQKDWKKANRLLKDAWRQASDEPRVLLAQARLSYARWQAENQSSDAKKAIQSYRNYLKRSPNSPYRGEIQEDLRELEYGQAGVKLNQAITVLCAGEFSRAWDFLDDVESITSDWAELAYRRGQICMISAENNSHYDQTGTIAERYWRQAEKLPEARLALANLYYKRGDLNQAEQEAQVAVKQAPGWVSPLLLLGEVYQLLGKFPESREMYQKVIELSPNSLESEQAERELELRPGLPDEPLELNLEKFMEVYGPEVKDIQMLERLEKIVFQLYQANGLSGTLPKVILLASDSRNASSVPPNQLFVTVGLMKFIDSQPSLQPIADDVVAFILGHEWTHILHNDYERSEKIQLLMSGLVPERSISWLHIRSGLGRVAEVSADRQGLLFAYRAGYDPYAAIAWCEATIQEEGDWDSNGNYPSLRERKGLMLNLLEGPMRQAYQSFEIGVKAFRSGELEEATYAFEAYLRLFPNDCAALENLSIVYFLRGVSLLKRKPWQPWRLEHDVKIKPDLSPFPPRIVTITDETRRWWNRAQRLACILLRLNPNSPGGYQIVGDIALGLGQAEKAEDMYQKGLAIEASYGGLVNNLGVLYALHGDSRRARELWTSLPKSPVAKWNLNQF